MRIENIRIFRSLDARQINNLLPQIHALISVSIMAGTDHDLLEFWLRHIQAYGLDKDAMSYKIYGYKVTWSTILNVSSFFPRHDIRNFLRS